MTRATTLLALAITVVAACGDAITNNTTNNTTIVNGDCGTAGHEADAGFPGIDTGLSPPTPDATAPDATSLPDATPEIDAGHEADAGFPADASAPDATTPDVGTPATLTAYLEAYQDPRIVLAGEQRVVIGHLRLQAIGAEGFRVTRIPVLNDLAGSFDFPEEALGLDRVTLEAGGNSFSEILIGGYAQFSTSIIVPANGAVDVAILADVASRGNYGEAISGLKFRLGVPNMDPGFQAEGLSSGDTVIAAVVDVSGAQPMVVRVSAPTFATLPTTTTLINGQNTLYAWTVTAPANGPVQLARMVFEVHSTGLDSNFEDIRDFRLYTGPTGTTPIPAWTAVNIWASGAGPIPAVELSGGGLAQVFNPNQTGPGSSGDGVNETTYFVIVSFNDPSFGHLAAGENKLFLLRATITGASTNNTVTARLTAGDQQTELTSRTATTNPNTGKVYVPGDITRGLFIGSGQDFSNLRIPELNLIWSDVSADLWSYPSVNAGIVVSGSGSYDYTNGHLLQVPAAHTLTY